MRNIAGCCESRNAWFHGRILHSPAVVEQFLCSHPPIRAARQRTKSDFSGNIIMWQRLYRRVVRLERLLRPAESGGGVVHAGTNLYIERLSSLEQDA